MRYQYLNWLDEGKGQWYSGFNAVQCAKQINAIPVVINIYQGFL